MPDQTFRIISAPEEPKLTAEELRRLLWRYRKTSEWEIREVTNQKDPADARCPYEKECSEAEIECGADCRFRKKPKNGG